MIATSAHTNVVRNTTHKAVLPFYLYAALSFLVATVLLLFSGNAMTQHHFHPQTLAITHTMALGWGTMIILGASHQLVPVLVEAKLHSDRLAYLSFVLAATGIPLLIVTFYRFQFNWVAQAGGLLVNAAILAFFVNVFLSLNKGKKENVQALFLLTATAWLLLTTLLGFLLLLNLTRSILPFDSLHYLSLHAHLGVVGWFLLLVMGVGSRLLPMFLLSKYDEPNRLWQIYFLVNGGLVGFVLLFFFGVPAWLLLLPALAIFVALVLFGRYCRQAYRQRIRKHVDEPVKISLLSIGMMALPLVLLLLLIGFFLAGGNGSKLTLAYGFSIFFGWLTAIILGMTFKTLPFIVWNKFYHDKAGLGKTPNPKDLFSGTLFKWMGIAYLAGFVVFLAGIFLGNPFVLQAATFLLLVTAVLYNANIVKMLIHQPLVK